MKKPAILLLGLFAIVMNGIEAAAKVQVADIFGPEMILQRDKSLSVWGMADPGEKVTVSFAGQDRWSKADEDGNWLVKLNALSASDSPRTLVVKGKDSEVTFDDVLVGEVWLVLSRWVGKQYYMEGPVPNALTRVRSFGGSRDKSASPVPTKSFGKNGTWGEGRTTQHNLFSIPFANRLQEDLGVPVGLVFVAVRDLDALIPIEGFEAIPQLKDIASEVGTWYPDTPSGKKAYEQWYAQMQAWKKSLDKKLASGQPVTPSQPPMAPGPILKDPAQPTVGYNAVISPLVPFAFRGALHLHAGGMEKLASVNDPRYADKMRALIAGFRKVFDQEDLYFAFSQRSQPYSRHVHTVGGKDREEIMNFTAWAENRDRQRRVLPYDKTGMIVTLDLEDYTGAVSERFAQWALADVYGKGKESSGPLYKSHRIDGDRVIIEFDNIGSGLMAADFPEIGRSLVKQSDGKLRYFAVAGEDRIFHQAEARIDNNKVVVRSDAVKKPVAVRYACHFDPRGMNLYNQEGLPASPFNTDDWEVGDFDQTVEQLAKKNPEALVALLGYPTMLHSHAAAKALGFKGEAVALPLVKQLLASTDADKRCGGLRTLGYLYWMGILPRGSGYYGEEPQAVTPAVAKALDMIESAVKDPNVHVRRTAAEALSLIGSENEDTVKMVMRLALDENPLVRTAALRTCKYRFNTHDNNTAIAHAILARKPFCDHTTLEIAGTIINHFRLDGPVDYIAVGKYFEKIEPGRGSEIIPNLGDMLRRYSYDDDKRKALGHPEVMRGVLHLYALGYRKYFLYGVWHWVNVEEHVDAINNKIKELEKEIVRLNREKPQGWKDLSARYADAIEDLKDVPGRYIKHKK